jgi:NADH pyrophosphatase NudC (nudix superfamily)
MVRNVRLQNRPEGYTGVQRDFINFAVFFRRSSIFSWLTPGFAHSFRPKKNNFQRKTGEQIPDFFPWYSAACGIPHYPRIDPVVISGVVSKKTGKFLLIHGAKFPEGMHSVVSGFMNPGETIEEGVRREVKEETGVTVGKVVYISSQPWPFAGEIMIGCMGVSEDDDIEVDGTEISDVNFFGGDRI